MQHIIKRQIIDLRLSNKLQAFSMQQQISMQFWKQIVPVMEDVFNDFANEDEVVSLQVLEINLGSISEGELEQTQWNESFLNNIKQQIKNRLELQVKHEEAQVVKKADGVCRDWIFYMRHGYLPWNSIEINPRWYELVLEMFAADYRLLSTLKEAIKGNRNVTGRIVNQHSTSFLISLTEVITAENQANLLKAVDEVVILLKAVQTSTDSSFFDETTLRRNLWTQIIYTAATVNQQLTIHKIIELVLGTYKQELEATFRLKPLLPFNFDVISIPLQQLLDTIAPTKNNDREVHNPDSINDPYTILKAVEPKEDNLAGQNNGESTDFMKSGDLEISSEVEHKESMISEDQHISIQNDEALKLLEISLIDDSLPSQFLDLSEFSISEQISQDGIFVVNAGLVLINISFLINLFMRLNIINDKKFLNQHAQQKAIYLLHYLATGNISGREYELVMPKLMCAHALNIPVEKEVHLMQEELKEADEMLEACIEHWEKIKNTSIDGLREGFLQRKGKLSFRNKKVSLQVESSGIDVLLDYLPWNMSIIKLPWVKEVITVEWR